MYWFLFAEAAFEDLYGKRKTFHISFYTYSARKKQNFQQINLYKIIKQIKQKFDTMKNPTDHNSI